MQHVCCIRFFSLRMMYEPYHHEYFNAVFAAFICIFSFFKESERSAQNRSLDNEDAMYLFIAPGLAVFYSDNFWQALLYLGSVCLLGLMLAIIVKSKAKKRLTRDDAIGFTIASFLFLGL
ncbi:hypothetical protein P4S63_18205 [Pseudoalteromonas sp. B193]